MILFKSFGGEQKIEQNIWSKQGTNSRTAQQHNFTKAQRAARSTQRALRTSAQAPKRSLVTTTISTAPAPYDMPPCCRREICYSGAPHIARLRSIGEVYSKKKLPAGKRGAQSICGFIGHAAPSAAAAAVALSALEAVRARPPPCTRCAIAEFDHECAEPPLMASRYICRVCGAMLTRASVAAHRAMHKELEAAERRAALAGVCSMCIEAACPCVKAAIDAFRGRQ